jgi:hypothetical protein
LIIVGNIYGDKDIDRCKSKDNAQNSHTHVYYRRYPGKYRYKVWHILTNPGNCEYDSKSRGNVDNTYKCGIEDIGNV